MPKYQVVHFNIPRDQKITRCGRQLRKLKWTTDVKDVTCNSCNKYLEQDNVV